MKAFRFTLQPLRTLRERQEQVALHEYARHVIAAARARENLANASSALERGWAEVEGSVSKDASAGARVRGNEFCASLGRQQHLCAQQLRTADEQLRRAWHTLMNRRKASAVVDVLLEKQKRQHQSRRRKVEQKELDELGRRRSSALSPAGETGGKS